MRRPLGDEAGHVAAHDDGGARREGEGDDALVGRRVEAGEADHAGGLVEDVTQRRDQLPARGVRAIALPWRTSRSSPSSRRSRASAWLIAGWERPTRAAARVTERSSRSASSGTSRLRSTAARRSRFDASDGTCSVTRRTLPAGHYAAASHSRRSRGIGMR